MQKKISLSVLMFSMIFCLSIKSQETLSTLIRVGDKELENTLTFNKDIEELSFYDIEGNSIEMVEAESLLASYKYFPEFYTDENKVVEAVMIKKMSDDTPSAKTKFKSLRIFKAEQKKNRSLKKKTIDFSAIDMDGKSFTLSELKGKVVVMNFWFIRCKPCITEMPGLNKIVEKYENNTNVVFLAFALDRKSSIVSFLKEYRFLYHIIPSSQQIRSRYGIGSFPTNIVIDQNGHIVYEKKGFGPNTIFNLENKIASLIK